MKKSCHLTAELSLKSLSDDGRFAGYASVFNVLDNQRDIVLPGAFTRHLGRGHDVKLLWQHRMDEPIGVIEDIFEDENGLYVEGRLLMEGARANEAFHLLKEGVIKGLSIGYTPQKHRVDPKTGIRELQEVDLWEVSLVTFPANDAAQVTVVKGGAFDGQSQRSNTASRGSISNGEQQKNIAASPQLIELSDALSNATARLRLSH